PKHCGWFNCSLIPLTRDMPLPHSGISSETSHSATYGNIRAMAVLAPTTGSGGDAFMSIRAGTIGSWSDGLGAQLADQRVRHFEIGIDVLDVIVVVERIDQLDDLLALLVVDRDRVLRPPGQRCLARLA